MEPLAVLRSQLSVRGQFQDGSVVVHCQYLTVPFILSLCCCKYYVTVSSVVSGGALESITTLWQIKGKVYSYWSVGGVLISLPKAMSPLCGNTYSRYSDNVSRHSCSPVHIRTFSFDLLSDILRGPCNS